MTCAGCGLVNRDDARFCGRCGAPAPATPGTVDVMGRDIAGRYRVLAKLGQGGMGTVFRAEQLSLKRQVAVKLLRPDVSLGPVLLRRFNTEAEAVAKLSHPNTVNIYDFGQDRDGTLFIAMELLDGPSLRQVIHRDAPLPVRRALAIAAQIAASLADAHARAIVHRDLKPDNVMLQDRGRERDVVRVVDFGIAQLRDDARATRDPMTQDGDLLGTPQYMAPEQIRGEAIDGRTDVYALGCVLYEMVTAQPPHHATTVLAMLSKHLLEAPVPPSQRRPDLAIPPAIDALILGALAKTAEARPPTMEAFGEQIAALLHTMPPAAPVRHDASYPRPAARVDTPAAYSVIAPAAAALTALPPIATTRSVAAAPPSRRRRAAIAITGVLAVGAAAGAVMMVGHREHATIAVPDDARATVREPVAPLAVEAPAPRADAGVPPPPAWLPQPAPPAVRPPTPAAKKPPAPSPARKPAPPAVRPPAPPPAAETPAPPAPPPAPPGSTIEGQRIALGQGIQLIAPAGLQVKTTNGTTIVSRRNAVILAIPLPRGNNDPMQLTQFYTGDKNLKFEALSSISVGGSQRPLTTYFAKVNGIDSYLAAVPLLGPGYRMAVMLVIPARFATDPAVLALRTELYTRRLILP
jgi:hypothetical protein